MSSTVAISLNVNGRAHTLEISTNLLLVDLLRDLLGLRGTKVGCDQGACGSCTVLIDGAPITSCLTFAFAADGRNVTTIEALAATDGTLDRVQAAFHESGVPQCGFCTPGMVMLAKGLSRYRAEPDAHEIDRWLSANICRCSGYQVFRRALSAEMPGAAQ